MNLRHGSKESPDINLTPLIDVVFLLLIFFMVSTTFERDSELSIELPEATVEPEAARDDRIEVTIDSRGRFYVNGKPLVNIQLTSVRQALLKEAGTRKDPPIVISADAKTPHQAVMTVMDAAQQLGFVHLSFAARLPGEAIPRPRNDTSAPQEAAYPSEVGAPPAPAERASTDKGGG